MFVVDSKCTYTRDGKRKGQTECRTKESTEEGTETKNEGNISYAHRLSAYEPIRSELIPVSVA